MVVCALLECLTWFVLCWYLALYLLFGTWLVALRLDVVDGRFDCGLFYCVCCCLAIDLLYCFNWFDVVCFMLLLLCLTVFGLLLVWFVAVCWVGVLFARCLLFAFEICYDCYLCLLLITICFGLLWLLGFVA